MGGVAAVVVADLAQPAFRIAAPVQGMHKPEAFVAPLLERTLEKRGLFREGVRFIADNAQAGIRGNVYRLAGHGNVVHVVPGKPMVGAEIVEIAAGLADRPARCADPEVAVKSLGQTGGILVGQTVISEQRGQCHAAHDGNTAIGGDVEPAALDQHIPRVLRGHRAPVDGAWDKRININQRQFTGAQEIERPAVRSDTVDRADANRVGQYL